MESPSTPICRTRTPNLNEGKFDHAINKEPINYSLALICATSNGDILSGVLAECEKRPQHKNHTAPHRAHTHWMVIKARNQFLYVSGRLLFLIMCVQFM